MIMRKWWEKKPSALDRYFGAMTEWRTAMTKRADLATERLDMQWAEIDRAHCRIDLLLDRLEEEDVDSPTQMFEGWAG